VSGPPTGLQRHFTESRFGEREQQTPLGMLGIERGKESSAGFLARHAIAHASERCRRCRRHDRFPGRRSASC